MREKSILLHIAFLSLSLLSWGCNNDISYGLKLNADGKLLHLAQRSSAIIEGHNHDLTVRIGDITGGKVLLTIEDKDKTILRDYIAQAEQKNFKFDGKQYSIDCTKQTNVLVGTDAAIFLVRDYSASRELTSISGTIEQLLAEVRNSNVIFIRNGTEHTADQAADHLRTKWLQAKDEVKTVEDFIDKIAARSSITGKTYQVRLTDGSIVEAGPWLRERWKNMKSIT